MGRGTAGGHPARLPELLIARPILPASADPGPVPGGAQAGCRGAGPGRLPGRGQRCFPELPWAQPGLHRVCGAGPGVPVVCRQDLRVTSGHRRLCPSQTQSSASSSPRQGHLGLVTGGHTGILTTPRHWLAGSCADRAGAQPLWTPRCPGPAPAPTSASAPAVGHRPPGHSGTLRTSGPRTFRADGARGPVRSGLAAPRPTGGRGRRTSQKIPVLCGDPSPKTLGPSQVSDSAL